jgi:hypothetical protein
MTTPRSSTRVVALVRLVAAAILASAGCAGTTAGHLRRGRLDRACAVAHEAPVADVAHLTRALRGEGLRVELHALSAEDFQRLVGFVPESTGHAPLFLLIRIERGSSVAEEIQVKAAVVATTGDTHAARLDTGALRLALGLPREPPAAPPSSSRGGSSLGGLLRVGRGLVADVVLLGTAGTVNLNARDCRDSPGTTCVLGTVAGAARDSFRRAPARAVAPPPPAPTGPPPPTEKQKQAALDLLDPKLALRCGYYASGHCELLQLIHVPDGPGGPPQAIELDLYHRAFGRNCGREKLRFPLPPGPRLVDRVNAITPRGPRPLAELDYRQVARPLE